MQAPHIPYSFFRRDFIGNRANYSHVMSLRDQNADREGHSVNFLTYTLSRVVVA